RPRAAHSSASAAIGRTTTFSLPFQSARRPGLGEHIPAGRAGVTRAPGKQRPVAYGYLPCLCCRGTGVDGRVTRRCPSPAPGAGKTRRSAARPRKKLEPPAGLGDTCRRGRLPSPPRQGDRTMAKLPDEVARRLIAARAGSRDELGAAVEAQRGYL